MVFGTLTVAGVGYVLARVLGGHPSEDFLKRFGGTTVVFDEQYRLVDVTDWNQEIVAHINAWLQDQAGRQKVVTVADRDGILEWVGDAIKIVQKDLSAFDFIKTDAQREAIIASATPWASILQLVSNADELLTGIMWILTAHVEGGRPWRIVDQNNLAPAKSMYTGCWFYYLATAIVHYYPKILDKICGMLEEHGFSSDYDDPKELIKKLRRTVFIEALKQYDTNERIKEAVKVAVISYDMSYNIDSGTRALTIDSMVSDHDLQHTIVANMDRFSYRAQKIAQFEAGAFISDYSEAKRDAFYKERFTYDVLCFAQTSCGADASIFNELMAYALNICIVHVEANLSKAMSRVFHDYLIHLPDGGLRALSPHMHVVKVVNLPKLSDVAAADDLTVWSFITNVPGGGHAMFMIDHAPQSWDPKGAPCDLHIHDTHEPPAKHRKTA